jgi:hypothetical protein
MGGAWVNADLVSSRIYCDEDFAIIKVEAGWGA